MAQSAIMVHAHCLAALRCALRGADLLYAEDLLQAALSVDSPRGARLREVCGIGATPKPQVALSPEIFTPWAKKVLEASQPYLASRNEPRVATKDPDCVACALLRGALDLADHESLFETVGLSAETVRLALQWSDS